MRRLRCNDDAGASLVLVLVFLAVFGLLVVVLLGQTSTNFARTTVTRGYNERGFAADAGVQAAITRLRAEDTLCPTAGSTDTLAPLTVNGKAVTVTCRTISGASLGSRGYALVTTDPTTSSFDTQSGGGGVKRITGSVFASGLSNSIDVVIKNGSIREHASGSTCSTAADRPGNLLFEPSLSGGVVSSSAGAVPVPPNAYQCTSDSWTAFDPGITLGTAPALHASPLPDRTTGSGASQCYIFRPGTYSGGITLGNHNYLASGVYYFPSGTIDVTSADIVGGAPAPGDTQINSATACASDASLTATPPVGGQGDTIQGTGVTIVLGGNAKLVANNPSGLVELYTRTGGGSAETGTQNVSVVTVPSSPPVSIPAWVPSSRAVSDPVVQVGTGSTPAFSAHGLLYLPGHMLDMNATNSSVAQLVGGVVAGRVLFKASASATGIGISIASGAGRRRLEIVATASQSGAASTTTRAVIDIENDPSRTLTIDSWYTRVT